MALIFFSRSSAARHAVKSGLRAFECQRPFPSADPSAWTYASRPMGPGVEYAEMVAADFDFVHHIEMTEQAVPILVVTCSKEQLAEFTIPELFKVEPLTHDMWETETPYRAKAPSILPRAVVSIPLPLGVPPLPPGAIIAPVAKRERSPRVAGGAKAVCREVYLSNPNMSKQEYVTACVARGIFEGTAKARYTDIVREEQGK